MKTLFKFLLITVMLLVTSAFSHATQNFASSDYQISPPECTVSVSQISDITLNQLSFSLEVENTIDLNFSCKTNLTDKNKFETGIIQTFITKDSNSFLSAKLQQNKILLFRQKLFKNIVPNPVIVYLSHNKDLNHYTNKNAECNSFTPIRV